MTGGVLLGTATAADVWVEAATGPGPRARHRLGSFVPDHAHQEGLIERAYFHSGRTLAYLGDWHTHPLGGPAPSHTDLGTLAAIAGHDAARQERPIMVILWRAAPWAVSVWRLRHRGAFGAAPEVEPLEVVATQEL